MNATCVVCQHWTRATASDGRCQRRAPTVVQNKSGDGATWTATVWPTTNRYDWCGEIAPDLEKWKQAIRDDAELSRK